MIKITQCSKAIGTNHVPKFCSPSPFIMTSSNEQNFILQVKKQQTNKQWETKRKNKHSLAQFKILPALINSKLNHINFFFPCNLGNSEKVQMYYDLQTAPDVEAISPSSFSRQMHLLLPHTANLNESNQQNTKKRRT